MLSECDSADCWGSGVVAQERSSALKKPFFSNNDRVELCTRCHCSGGSRWGEADWSLSVGSPVERVSAGGPQPALSLFCHFAVDLLLILFSSLLPLEKSKFP